MVDHRRNGFRNNFLVDEMKALDESIEHWERLADCESHQEIATEGWGAMSCSLCVEFMAIYNCLGCPVFASSNQLYCMGTPYQKAYEYNKSRDAKMNFDKAKWQGLATAELNFLRSLRSLLRSR